MIKTEKDINVYQLGQELGAVPLRCVGPSEKGVWKISANVDDKTLEKVVNAHKADPSVAPPPEPPPPLSADEKIDHLIAVLCKRKLIDADDTDAIAAATAI